MTRTKGGAGGPTTTVSTLPQLSAAAAASEPLIIVVQGAISGAAKINVTSNKSIIGRTGSCEYIPPLTLLQADASRMRLHVLPALTGIGLTILGQKNVIIRNMKIAKVLAAYGDGVTINLSTNVWVDHCDISGDENVGKDTYDGACLCCVRSLIDSY